MYYCGARAPHRSAPPKPCCKLEANAILYKSRNWRGVGFLDFSCKSLKSQTAAFFIKNPNGWLFAYFLLIRSTADDRRSYSKSNSCVTFEKWPPKTFNVIDSYVYIYMWCRKDPARRRGMRYLSAIRIESVQLEKIILQSSTNLRLLVIAVVSFDMRRKALDRELSLRQYSSLGIWQR